MEKPIQQKQKAGIVTIRYDTHNGDIRKIRHSGPGWSGVWNLRVVQFPVKHSPPFNKYQYIIAKRTGQINENKGKYQHVKM